MATKVLEFELSEGLRGIATEAVYTYYRILVRLNRVPLGWVIMPHPNAPAITVAQLAEAIKKQIGWQLLLQNQFNHYCIDAEDRPATEGISVVVCTRDRTELLATCLNTLMALDYPNYEIIVIDNAPSNKDTYHLMANLPVRYVLEERPGLDWARNRGIAEAKYGIIAFTDDDARADRFWLQAISKTMQDPSIAAVTGLVAPAELDTMAQKIFEHGYGGMGHGFRRRDLDSSNMNERQLIRAGSMGIGANMAFRRSALTQAGAFDTALDVGTPSGGAGDVEMFHRLLAQGYKVVHEPCMLVWHTHRRELAQIRKLVKDNGRSFGCYLFTCYRNKSIGLYSVTRYLLIDWLVKWVLRNFIVRPPLLSRKYALIEFTGMLQSPFAYVATQARAKKIARQRSTLPTDKEAVT